MQGTNNNKLRDSNHLSAKRKTDDGNIFIGRMCVSQKVLGHGSAGTVVFEGSLDGRPIAVKRMLRQVTIDGWL